MIPGLKGFYMPVGGFIVSVKPEHIDDAMKALAAIESVEVHGHDDKGNVVVVLDCITSDDMEAVVSKMYRIDSVLAVGLTYLNAEDEVAKMESGEYVPSRYLGKKHK